MTSKPTPPSPKLRRLRDAQRLYRRWTKTLTVYLRTLEAETPSEPAAAGKHQAALASHYKTLERLSELERDIDGRLEPIDGVTLDLDAARSEILDRLARLDDARGTGAVS